jgi:antitoxin MazE
MSVARTQLVKWGNSHAVRIPKTVLDQLDLHEGDEVVIRIDDGRIFVETPRPKLTLEVLVAGITPSNRHQEQNWGRPTGDEVW